MRHRLLWLLVPVAAWGGYATAPPAAKSAPPASPEAAKPAENPGVATLAAALKKAGPQELQKELEELVSNNALPDWDLRMKLLCARWAEVDPAQALTIFEEAGAPWIMRGQLLVEWALLDSDSTWRALDPGPDGDEDRRWISSKLLNEDQETFMWWFRQVREPMPDGNPAWLAIAERHGKELEEIAAGLIEKQKAGELDCTPIYRLLAAVRAEKDPAAAIEWAGNLDPAVRNEALRTCLEKWIERDPLEAWNKVTGGDPLLSSPEVAGNSTNPITGVILTRLAKEDPMAAMKLILESKDQDAVFNQGGIDAMRQALPEALANGKLSALEAYRLINSATGSKANLGLNVLPYIWQGLSAEQLASAAKEISAEPNERHYDTTLGGIASAWVKKDPAAAIAFITAIKDPGLREEIYSGCFTKRTGGKMNLSEMTGVLESLPPEERALAYCSATGRYGPPKPGEVSYSGVQPDPEAAAILLSKLPASESLTRATTINAIQWGQLDPGSAVAWADQITDPAARAAAFGGAFEGWAFHDPFAAADWLTRRKAGPERDAATLPVVRKLAQTNPASAWEWAGSMGEGDPQLQARTAALQAWAKTDPLAAQAAYQKLAPKLSREAAEKLSKSLSGS